MRRNIGPKGVLAGLALAVGLATSATAATTIELSGRAVDLQGEPAAGVRVLAATWPERGESAERILTGGEAYDVIAEAKTDRHGRYRLSVPPDVYTVVLRADGLRPLNSFPIYAFESTTAPTATVIPARDFTFRVLDPDGRPIPDAWLYFDSQNRNLRLKGVEWFTEATYGRTDDDGRIQLTGGVDESRHLQVFAEGFPVATATPPDDGREITVRLEAGLAIDVKTVDARGEALPSTWLFHRRIPRGRTDGQGWTTLHFDRQQLERGFEMEALRGLLRGETTLSLPADLPENLPVKSEQPPVAAAPGSDPSAVIRLEPHPMITGTVVDAFNDEPIAGAAVWERSRPLQVAHTAADGTFELPMSGSRLMSQAHGYGKRSVAVEEEVHFTLRPANTARGRVLDPRGDAVEGATVTVHAWSEGRSRSSFREGSKEPATTDAAGRFRLPAPAGRSLELTATAPGYGPGYGKLSAPAITDGRGIDIQLGWERSAVGEVVDPRGRPVPGATVLLVRPAGAQDKTPPLDTFTGPDGLFEVEGLGTGEYRLEVSAEGFPPLAVPSLEVAEEDSQLDLGRLQLEAGMRLKGRVTADDGEPLSGVKISATSSRVLWTSSRFSPPVTASSAADGRFELVGLAPEQLYQISTYSRGWAEKRITATAEDGPVEFRLEPELEVRGRVVDTEGRPIHDAGVAFSRGSLSLGTRTDEDGRFQHRTVPGRFRLVAGGPNHRQWVRNNVKLEPGMADLEITLETGLSMSGRVLDPSGRPVEGAKLALALSSNSVLALHDSTDPQGRFFVGGLEAGPSTIEARHPTWGFASTEVELTESVADLEIRFPGGAEVSGVVLDAAEGSAIADATIRLHRLESTTLGYRTTSDGDGGFRLSDVSGGRYLLNASGAGYASTTFEVDISEAGERDLVLELASGATLTGQILGAQGSSLARFSLTSRWGDYRSPRLDGGSEYLFHHLSVGEWKLEGTLDDGRIANRSFMVTEADRELEINLEFEDDGLAVTGVVLRGEAGVVGATVRALQVGRSSGGKEVSTGGGGRFQLRGLLGGEYAVYVHEQGQLIAHRRLQLHGEDHWRIEVSGTQVGGRVLDGDGRPLAGLVVRLKPTDHPSGHATSSGATDRGGRFFFSDVTPGRYRLDAASEEYAPEHLDLIVHDNDITGLELVLDKPPH
ncbi:MAG: carboxypeptidase regulatory-like domain-containing protein [Acidobacteriota bacterium]